MSENARTAAADKARRQNKAGQAQGVQGFGTVTKQESGTNLDDCGLEADCNQFVATRVTELRAGNRVSLDGDVVTITSIDGDHKSSSIEFDNDPDTIASYAFEDTLDLVPDFEEGIPNLDVENLETFTRRRRGELSAQYPDADAADVRENAEFQAYDRYFTALNDYARAGKQVSLDMQEGIRENNRRYLQDNHPNVANDPKTSERFAEVGKTRSVWSWDDLESLPNETFVDAENRKATTTFLMHDDGDGHKVYAEMTTSNDRQGKSMRNSVTVFGQEVRNSFNVKSYDPIADSLMIRKTPLARYSEKALVASHDELIFELRDYMGDNSSNPRATKAVLNLFLRGFEKGNDLENEGN